MPDHIFIRQGFDPAEAIRISPYRIKYPGKVNVHSAALFFEEVRQQEAHGSKNASGYSFGKCSSFQNFCAGGLSKKVGLNLFQLLGEVPPSVPTLPVSTFRKWRVAGNAHPPRLPLAALRQLWVAKLRTCVPDQTGYFNDHFGLATPLSLYANSGVYSSYSSGWHSR
jgi:hypothetical protein